jgi:hypothetical protein
MVFLFLLFELIQQYIHRREYSIQGSIVRFKPFSGISEYFKEVFDHFQYRLFIRSEHITFYCFIRVVIIVGLIGLSELESHVEHGIPGVPSCTIIPGEMAISTKLPKFLFPLYTPLDKDDEIM